MSEIDKLLADKDIIFINNVEIMTRIAQGYLENASDAEDIRSQLLFLHNAASFIIEAEKLIERKIEAQKMKEG